LIAQREDNGKLCTELQNADRGKIDDFFYPTLIATEDRLFGVGEHGEVYDVLPK